MRPSRIEESHGEIFSYSFFSKRYCSTVLKQYRAHLFDPSLYFPHRGQVMGVDRKLWMIPSHQIRESEDIRLRSVVRDTMLNRRPRRVI